jgi:ketosteroid isomerase-like protein
MSQENVELMRKSLEHWNRGDLDAFVELSDDDVVLRPAEGGPEGVYFGKDAVRSFYESFAQTMGHDTVFEDVIDAGGSVVVRMRAHGVGAHSGIEGDMPVTMVVTVRKGKAVLIEHFLNHDEALEAAGLRE